LSVSVLNTKLERNKQKHAATYEGDLMHTGYDERNNRLINILD